MATFCLVYVQNVQIKLCAESLHVLLPYIHYHQILKGNNLWIKIDDIVYEIDIKKVNKRGVQVV